MTAGSPGRVEEVETMSRSGRSRSVWFHVVVAVVATAAIAVPVTVGATGESRAFPDVPGTHPFADEIGWLEGVAVTGGFPDGTYKPAQPVTRGSMAAFMQRLYDVQDDMAWMFGTGIFSAHSHAAGTWAPVTGAQVTVQVPDGVYANISARFSAESLCGGSSGWCSVRIMVSEDGGAFQEMYPNPSLDFAFDSPGGAYEAHAMERMGFGSPGSTYTIRVEAARANANVTTFQLDDWSLVAETDLQPSDYLPL